MRTQQDQVFNCICCIYETNTPLPQDMFPCYQPLHHRTDWRQITVFSFSQYQEYCITGAYKKNTKAIVHGKSQVCFSHPSSHPSSHSISFPSFLLATTHVHPFFLKSEGSNSLLFCSNSPRRIVNASNCSLSIQKM